MEGIPMWFGKTAEPKYDRTLIAELAGERTTKGMTGEGMAVFGFVAMLIAIVVEDSAIRLAAWGAVWTGWNVLCGITILKATRTDYLSSAA
jgi:hypothetical protein